MMHDGWCIMMMMYDDDWWWQLWCMTDDGSWWWCTMMIDDGKWMMDHDDDDGHGCDPGDHLMMPLELWYVWSLCSMFVMILTLMIETLDSYSRGTWYLWATLVDVLPQVVWIVLTWLVRALADPLVDWQSTIFMSYSSSTSIFINFRFCIQLPFAINAKGGEMFRGRDILVRGSLLSVVINDKGGDCWSVWVLHGLACFVCVLCLSFMSTKSFVVVLSLV